MNPSVAVIMPARNGMPFITEALASVWAQNYEPLEVVVVDDGSTDDTKDYVRSVKGRKLRLLEFENQGPAAARNAGLRATSSDCVAFLDADDLWFPGSLHRLAEALAHRPDAGFAQGLILNFKESAEAGRQLLTVPYRFLNLGANLFRRSLFDSVGLLDAGMTLAEDMDFLMRCWEYDVPKAEISAVVLHYRRHPGSMTHGLSGVGCGTLKAYKKQIDRTRDGSFDPNRPRQISLSSYLGAGPRHQDGAPLVRPQ